jgi:hypothetical protein
MEYLSIEYYTKDVWGAELAYPTNDAGRLVCALAGTKTLTPISQAIVEEFGGTFKEVLRPRS